VFQFSAVKDSNLSDLFALIGYNSMLSITNMATLFVFMLAAPLLILILAITNKVFPFWKRFPNKHKI